MHEHIELVFISFSYLPGSTPIQNYRYHACLENPHLSLLSQHTAIPGFPQSVVGLSGFTNPPVAVLLFGAKFCFQGQKNFTAPYPRNLQLFFVLCNHDFFGELPRYMYHAISFT